MREAYEPRKYRELFSAQDVIYFRCAVGGRLIFKSALASLALIFAGNFPKRAFFGIMSRALFFAPAEISKTTSPLTRVSH